MKKLILPSLFFHLLSASLLQAQDIAHFSVSSQKVCLGTTIQAFDQSTGGNGDVSYYFGDGTTTTPPNPNPVHMYATVNTFNLRQVLPISGTVIDPETGNPVGYQSYTVPVTVVSNAPLDAGFGSGIPGDVIVTIRDTRFDTYDIDFGDGTAIETVSRDPSGETSVAHTYEDWFGVEFSATVKGKFSSGLSCPNTDASFPITAYVTPTVAEEESSISLYPNPVLQGESLHFTNGNFKTAQVIVYNSAGNKVLESADLPDALSALDLSNLQPGLYLIQLMNKQQEFVTKQLMVK
jgi:hypothetical protein